jgi:hypothetical protein
MLGQYIKLWRDKEADGIIILSLMLGTSCKDRTWMNLPRVMSG